MSEMVERVSRAISLWDGNDWDGQIGGRACVRDRYRDMARAAIEAMREPTSAMLLAGHGANLCENAPEVWAAMIDEELK